GRPRDGRGAGHPYAARGAEPPAGDLPGVVRATRPSGGQSRRSARARGRTAGPGSRGPAGVGPPVDDEAPEYVHDLPGGAKRLVARARGIHATVVGGAVVYRDGKETGARPGTVLRSGAAGDP